MDIEEQAGEPGKLVLFNPKQKAWELGALG